ncbi:MAG: putative quorum-sensing-regulated virulence factor [Thiotrichales bacterium]
MPFGTHQDKEMSEVPAKYLLWLYDELNDRRATGTTLDHNEKNVFDYIEDNLDVLNAEVGAW